MQDSDDELDELIMSKHMTRNNKITVPLAARRASTRVIPSISEKSPLLPLDEEDSPRNTIVKSRTSKH